MGGAMSETGEDTGSAPTEMEERLRGDIDALSEFAQELSLLRDRQPARVQPWESRVAEGDEGRQTAYTSGRINADAETVEQGLAKLVLTLIELIRQLLERQAIRRMETGSLTDDEIERMGETFMKLEQKMEELKLVFGLENEELNLSLGPLGNLLTEE
jgi:hypothetical protein